MGFDHEYYSFPLLKIWIVTLALKKWKFPEKIYKSDSELITLLCLQDFWLRALSMKIMVNVSQQNCRLEEGFTVK